MKKLNLLKCLVFFMIGALGSGGSHVWGMEKKEETEEYDRLHRVLRCSCKNSGSAPFYLDSVVDKEHPTAEALLWCPPFGILSTGFLTRFPFELVRRYQEEEVSRKTNLWPPMLPVKSLFETSGGDSKSSNVNKEKFLDCLRFNLSEEKRKQMFESFNFPTYVREGLNLPLIEGEDRQGSGVKFPLLKVSGIIGVSALVGIGVDWVVEKRIQKCVAARLGEKAPLGEEQNSSLQTTGKRAENWGLFVRLGVDLLVSGTTLGTLFWIFS